MDTIAYRYVRTLLFQLEPETAHAFTLNCLKMFSCPHLVGQRLRHFPQKPTSAFGIEFPNPVGLAAGLDKNGDYIDALFGLGFGFIEVGAVTPKAQSGNLKPRIFRLPQAQALINRMGFNNFGVDYLVERLKRRKIKGIVGVNVGKNLTTILEKAHEDYRYCFEKLYSYVDYITINISSPNTPQLRQLQSENYLTYLLIQLKEDQLRLEDQHQKHVPLLLKIALDLTKEEIQAIATLTLKYGINGIVATNTTISRQGVEKLPHSNEVGGLSGKPLFSTILQVIKQLYSVLGRSVPIIAVGGISSGEDALALLKAGACLIQLYTGLIYEGPNLVKNIVNFLTRDRK